MTSLPPAILIDLDDTILSAYGRPDIAWNTVATEFATDLAPLSPEQVAIAIVDSGRKFWATAQAGWPTAILPTGKKRCSSFRAPMMRSMR
jgi:putative hydrolase of the HAD superfamily